MLLGTDSRALRKNQNKEETPQSPLISDDRYPKGPKAPPGRNPSRSTKYRTKLVVRNAPKRSANGFERKSTLENYIYLSLFTCSKWLWKTTHNGRLALLSSHARQFV